jgi:hypothetical protein
LSSFSSFQEDYCHLNHYNTTIEEGDGNNYYHPFLFYNTTTKEGDNNDYHHLLLFYNTTIEEDDDTLLFSSSFQIQREK